MELALGRDYAVLFSGGCDIVISYELAKTARAAADDHEKSAEDVGSQSSKLLSNHLVQTLPCSL